MLPPIIEKKIRSISIKTLKNISIDQAIEILNTHNFLVISEKYKDFPFTGYICSKCNNRLWNIHTDKDIIFSCNEMMIKNILE